MSKNRRKKIEQKFLDFISRKKLIERRDKVLVAFSGGADSAFVLSLLNKFKGKFGIEIIAAHINHGLRGPEAERDEKHCAEFSGRIGAPFFAEKVDVRNFAKRKKLSPEEAARILRYEALDKIAKKTGATKIATAHNLNDNAETVLLNLLKGGGTQAVAGIPAKRGKIIRPALAITREEIEFWLAETSTPFVNDSTNFENDYLRNRLRNLILPEIRAQINPKADEAIFNFSGILSAQNEIVKKLTEQRAEELFSEESKRLIFDVPALSEIDKLNLGNLLRYALRKKFDYDLEFSDVLKIENLIDYQKGKTVELKNKLRAIRERRTIVFYFEKNGDEKIYVEFMSDAELKTPQGVVSVRTTRRKKKRLNCELVCADSFSGKFVLRNWRAGDKFKPLGMKRNKKISDFLTDLKIPSAEKKKILVLENNGKIIWVVGFRISDDVKITEQTKKRLELCVNTKI